MKLYVAPGTSISSTRALLSCPLSKSPKLTDLGSSAPIWLWNFLAVSIQAFTASASPPETQVYHQAVSQIHFSTASSLRTCLWHLHHCGV